MKTQFKGAIWQRMLFTMMVSMGGMAANAQTHDTGCALFYQPIIEVENLAEASYTGIQVYYVIDRTKFMPLNRPMRLGAGESHLLQLPPLLAREGMHILEVYVQTAQANAQLGVRFRDAALVHEVQNVVPLSVAGQGEPVLSDDDSDTGGAAQQCACLSNAGGQKPLASLWYNYTRNAQGKGMVFASVANGQDWQRATAQTAKNNAACLQYHAEMANVGTRSMAKVAFVPEDQLAKATGTLPDEVSDSHSALAMYPNPIKGQATISFVVDEPGSVNMEVYSFGGLKLKTLLDTDAYPAGSHKLAFDPAHWPAGLYLCRMKTATGEKTIKFIINR